MAASSPSPADLRNMLGANLRKLTHGGPSISALCRDLKINRTQFNRYLAGESFPRPDVLYRICAFFDVDARILLEPLEAIATSGMDPLTHPAIADFLGPHANPIGDLHFPTGFYRFSRHSFIDESLCVQNLAYVFEEDGLTFMRGYEPRNAMDQQGLPRAAPAREFRGVVLPQEGGIAIFVARRRTITATFNFLSPVPSIENNFWVGYTARTTAETVSSKRITRLVYESLGHDRSKVFQTARASGLCPAEALQPYHRRLLQLGTPFA